MDAHGDLASGGAAAAVSAGWLLRSPGVGKVVTLAPRGAYLEAGAVAGVLRILRREVDLVPNQGAEIELPVSAGGITPLTIVTTEGFSPSRL